MPDVHILGVRGRTVKNVAFTSALAALIASVMGVVVATAARNGADDRHALIPANVSALTSEATRVPRTSEILSSLGDLAPTSGTVHRLGNGLSLAWQKDGRICELA